MKFKIFAVLSFCVVVLKAQNTSEVLLSTKNSIRLHLAPVADQVLGLQYERMVSKKVSLSLGFYVKHVSFNTNFNSYKFTDKNTGFGYKPEVRVYPMNDDSYTLKGLYLGCYYFNFTESREIKGKYQYNELASGISKLSRNEFGLNIGWNWIIKKNFIIDLGTGIAYFNEVAPSSVEVKNSNGNTIFTESFTSGDQSGLIPNFRLSIGYAF